MLSQLEEIAMKSAHWDRRSGSNGGDGNGYSRVSQATGRQRGKVRVAIIGVGNCASSLVQGVEFYRDASEDHFVPGLMHVNLGGYHVRDIEFSAAFDINRTKVGRD